jgi:hypothetical protein
VAEVYRTPEVDGARKTHEAGDPKDRYPTADRAEKENASEKRKRTTDPVERAMLDQALERFRMASEGSENAQRLRELDDLKFDRAHLEDQWPPDVLRTRAGAIGAGGVTTGQRPCLVISRLDQPIQQVVNEARRAQLGINIKPKGKKASTAGATLRQGMIRAIEVDSRALNARLWALERAVKCGRGYYRVLKEYANDGDFDLDLVVAEIANQGSVYLDPYSGKADGSDAEWGFITDDLPHQEFFRRFPESKLSDPGLLETIGNLYPAWITDKMVRVAEYFYREYEERTLVFLDHESLPEPIQGFLDELPADMQQAVKDKKNPLPGLKTRKVQFPTVKHCFITAVDILEQTDWQGRYIPIIRVLGKRYNVEGEWSYQGMIFKAKDAQRSFNYMRSAQVEAVGLAPRANYIVDPKQIAGYKQIWETANTHNWAYLPAHMFNEEGKPYPQVQRVFAEPEIQGITLAVREAETDIKATTGRSDPSLGVYSRDRSGKAIEALKSQGELGSSNYLDMLADSINYEARILLDLLPYVYDRKGRIVRLMGDEDDEKLAMVGQPFMRGPNGQPQHVRPRPPLPFPPRPGMPPGAPPGMPPGAPPGMQPPGQAMMTPGGPPGGAPPPGQPPPMAPGQPPMAGQPGQLPDGAATSPPGAPPMPAFSLPMRPPAPPKQAEPEFYDLSEGEYSVIVTVGQSYPTQRDEDLDTFSRLFEAMPAFAQVLGDLYLAQRDSPTMQKAAERLRKMNPHAQSEDEGGMPPIPPQIQQMMQQLQQENQQLKQLADDNVVKNRAIEADMQMKQMDLQMRTQVETLKAKIEIEKLRGTTASKERIAQLQAETDLLEMQMKTQAEREKTQATIEADARLAQHQAQEADRDVQRQHVLNASKGELERDKDRRKDTLAERQAQRDEAMATRQADREEGMTARGAEHQASIGARERRREAGYDDAAATRDAVIGDVSESRAAARNERAAGRQRQFEAEEAAAARRAAAAEAERDRRAAAKQPPSNKK